MNTKVLAISILTLIALGALVFFSFGPGATARAVRKQNPASLKTTPTQSSVGNKSVAFNTYHNRDLTENFFTIQFPSDWQTQSNKAGGYAFLFSDGTASIQSIDVPDNSTLELFILSQEEPKLKSSSAGHTKVSFKPLSVNGNEAYQLIYTSTDSGVNLQTTRTYISGADQAALIIFSTAVSHASVYTAMLDTIVNSFHWEQ